MWNNSSLNCLRRHHCHFDANDLIINTCDSMQWKTKENRIKKEFSFFTKIRHVSIHPNIGGKRDLFSLLMTTTTSTGGEAWPLSSTTCFLVCTLIRSFEAPLQGQFSYFWWTTFKWMPSPPLRCGPSRTSHNVTRGCHIRSQCHTQRVSPLSH